MITLKRKTARKPGKHEKNEVKGFTGASAGKHRKVKDKNRRAR